jgi:hypothetical protein
MDRDLFNYISTLERENRALKELAEAARTWSKCSCRVCSGEACKAIQELYQAYRKVDAGKSA